LFADVRAIAVKLAHQLAIALVGVGIRLTLFDK
jgi:hypothetical protein